MQLSELARLLGAQLVLPPGQESADGTEVRNIRPINEAEEGDVTFLTSGHYAKYLADTRASAVILGAPSDDCRLPQLVHDNPYWAFAKTSQLFFEPHEMRSGISERAFVSEDAVLGKDVAIYPFAYVDRRARLGDRVVLFPGVYVGEDVVIGDDSVLHPNVVIKADCKLGLRTLVDAGAVVGGEGFGFAPGKAGLEKIAQSGRVRIGDDVEIGSNTSIDRGALADTVIGNGTKMDSHVLVGHNATVGEHCMLCGMSTLAGSAKVGNWVLIAGHGSVSNHVVVGDGVQGGAYAGFSKHTPKPGQYLGMPAKPAEDWRKEQVNLRRLPKLEKRIKELEEKLTRLTEQTALGEDERSATA